jgi:hypothetical protein
LEQVLDDLAGKNVKTNKPMKGTSMTNFPIGFWNGIPIEKQDAGAVKDWVDAGMTLAMSPEFDDKPEHAKKMHLILDAAQKNGIRVILCHAQSHYRYLTKNGEEAYRKSCAAAIKEYGSHPAVFGFYVGDEPGKEQFPDVCKAMRIQKELAPNLTPFLNHLPWYPGVAATLGYPTHKDYLDAYVAQAKPDVLCYDYYGQMNPLGEGWDVSGDGYFGNLREYEAASQRAGIPFWITLLSVGHFNYRCPKEDDFRWQLNTAVAHGARGVLWFYFYMGQPPYLNYRVSPIDEHWERTETFEWISRVNRTFLKRFGSVVPRLTLQRVSHCGKAWGGNPLFDGKDGLVSAVARSTTPWEAAKPEDAPLIVSEFKHADGRDCVMVVNNSQTKNVFATVTLRRAYANISRMGWEGKEEVAPVCGLIITKAGKGVSVGQFLAPGQMDLYLLE